MLLIPSKLLAQRVDRSQQRFDIAFALGVLR